MPVCNMCGESFDVEIEPGALMFGHPDTVKEAVPVWKAHICQGCETTIKKMFKIKPKKFIIIDDGDDIETVWSKMLQLED